MNVEYWLRQASRSYTLIAAAAVLFFAMKAIIGYVTYRHYNRRLREIERKLEALLGQPSE
ncbi:hypothetical protein [Paenibacillus sp. DMB20]|uniref:hypothetical protein n=1 Tax=Paenibacillus sp. DMB20 TaxID=1642570 RepID=UPI000627D641|nr:hypothetical protein [Paenibacillus sp. DMB20]KKO52302.1 hypothetical protein XI25_22275 [Paenibacillus sp. DMB20]